MKNPAAVSLGKSSWKKRRKKHGIKKMRQTMRALALKRHGLIEPR